MKIKNEAGLLIDEDDNRCVGYLMDFTGHGIYSPNGKLEVTKEEAETHNRILAEAEVKGLDENCQIGQHGTFYYVKGQVRTWTGLVVSETITRNGQSLTFQRKEKVFRGRLKGDADAFNFKRIK